MTDLHEEYERRVGDPPHAPGYRRQGIENFIDPSVPLGLDVRVWHYSVVLQDVNLGVGVSVGSRCEVGRGSTIGPHSRIGSGVFLPPNSRIGERVFIGPNVTFTDDRHPRVPRPSEDKAYEARPPVVEDRASIGAGATILPGVRIGHDARVAAGAIVTRDVPPGALVRCEPARQRPMSKTAALAFQREHQPA